MIQAELLLNARPVQGATADSATASVTVAAIPAQRHFLMSVEADYSAAPTAAFKTVTVKVAGVTVFVWRWDFAGRGPFSRALPIPIHGGYGEAISIELEASGTGGVTGRVGGMVASV